MNAMNEWLNMNLYGVVQAANFFPYGLQFKFPEVFKIYAIYAEFWCMHVKNTHFAP